MMDKIKAAKKKNKDFEDFMIELKGRQETEEEFDEDDIKPQNVLNSLDIAKKIALDLNLQSKKGLHLK